ncbi:MAG: hypothetical protein R3E86_11890 [Pseudomonadales bacterium]
MNVLKNNELIGGGLLGGLLLALASAAPAAYAADLSSCSCECVETSPGVAEPFEVCTGIFASQQKTQACSDTLVCPAVNSAPATTSTTEPSATADDTPEDAEFAEIGARHGLDCRPRFVYNAKAGEYRRHNVCMPAEWAEGRDRWHARRDALAERRDALAERREGRGKYEWQSRSRYGRHRDRDDD